MPPPPISSCDPRIWPTEQRSPPTTPSRPAPSPPNPATSGVWGVIGGMNIVGGNSGPGFTIVGGTNPYAGTSIVGGGGGPFGDGGGIFTGTGFSAIGTTTVGGGGSSFTGGGFSAIGTTTIGGGGPFGDGSGFYTGLGTGSRRFDGPMGGVMALAQTAQNFRESAQASIDRIVRNPQTTPAEFRIAMNAQFGLGDALQSHARPQRARARGTVRAALRWPDPSDQSAHVVPTDQHLRRRMRFHRF